MVFAGSASRRLGEAIAGRLGVRLGASEVIRFSEGNLFVRVLDNVRGRDDGRSHVRNEGGEAGGRAAEPRPRVPPHALTSL